MLSTDGCTNAGFHNGGIVEPRWGTDRPIGETQGARFHRGRWALESNPYGVKMRCIPTAPPQCGDIPPSNLPFTATRLHSKAQGPLLRGAPWDPLEATAKISSQQLLSPGTESLLNILHRLITSDPGGFEVAVDDVRLTKEVELDFRLRP